MKRLFSNLLFACMALVAISCDKEETIVDPPAVENPTFTSSNVKDGAVYFSFDTKQEVSVWDLVFKSNGPSPDFYLNTAALGGTHVQIYNTEETELGAVTSYDVTKLSTDPDTNVAGGNWYNYDMNTHKMSTKGLVYILHTATDNIYKFRIDNYAANVYTLQYARYSTLTKAFEATQTATVDKSSGPAMFSFAKGLIAAEKDWDVKFTVMPTEVPQMGVVSFPGIFLNSSKNVEAKAVAKTFADVDAATETGLTGDNGMAFVIGTTWFDYNDQTHRVTSKNHTYVLKTASGKRTKFRVDNYYNSEGKSGYMHIEYVDAK